MPLVCMPVLTFSYNHDHGGPGLLWINPEQVSEIEPDQPTGNRDWRGPVLHMTNGNAYWLNCSAEDARLIMQELISCSDVKLMVLPPQTPAGPVDPSGAHELTEPEVRDALLKELSGLRDYWLHVAGKTSRQQLDGLIFTILSLLDGEHAAMPAWVVAPKPPLGHAAYQRSRGSSWWPRSEDNLRIKADLSGTLHHAWAKQHMDHD